MKIVINNVLGKVSWSLRRSLIVLFTLFCTFYRCRLKSNLMSNIILRCFWVDDDLTKFSLKYKGEWWTLLIFHLLSLFLGSGLSATSFSIEKPNHLFLLNHCSDLLLLSLYFEQWRTEKCHPQIILDLTWSHQTSHWYRSERLMGQE